MLFSDETSPDLGNLRKGKINTDLATMIGMMPWSFILSSKKAENADLDLRNTP